MATGDVSNIGGREPPPPSWDGPDPCIQFPLYKRNVRLWGSLSQKLMWRSVEFVCLGALLARQGQWQMAWSLMRFLERKEGRISLPPSCRISHHTWNWVCREHSSVPSMAILGAAKRRFRTGFGGPSQVFRSLLAGGWRAGRRWSGDWLHEDRGCDQDEPSCGTIEGWRGISPATSAHCGRAIEVGSHLRCLIG